MATSAQNKKKTFHIDETDLLCKNGCGFYGNPAWQGFCSKCYREVYQTAHKAQMQHDAAKEASQISPILKKHYLKLPSVVLSFSHEHFSNFRVPVTLPFYNQPLVKEPRRISAESQKIGTEFAEFLKSIKRKPAALEISKLVSDTS
uniref:A20-type domain-containing protein n=1 Tax=Biomphalaria glabrata TaxID=6526 RepID=A0A2C9KBR1_BIOGL